MSEPLTIIAVFAVAAAAVLLLLPAARASRSPRSRTITLRGILARLQALGADHSGALRRDGAVLLRQFSALLQSGRAEAQAWADLRSHWIARGPLEGAADPAEEHPFAVVCGQVATSEQLGQGSAAGLRRCLRADAGELPPEVRRCVEQLIAVTSLSEQTGAPLSRLVEQLAEGMDEASELHAAVQTAAAGPKLTQVVLALLPLGGLGLGQLMGVSPLATLTGTSLGWLCLLLGLGLLAFGWWWSTRLIRGVVSDV
ncbi:hypothetical protein [Nesterenkonia cremea]|uniref:Tight adherence protein B n=1 Tax=Nesterenkonia cremea TaxID=1882340 RepID=A0A917ER23_9MICC|nr:hypothetical protein [Nesterenkonia cremea]GGE75417.1 hypothetical protein GCM10011401_23410 [Nesterenkonia cremea]